jgi:hypothetical protein
LLRLDPKIRPGLLDFVIVEARRLAIATPQHTMELEFTFGELAVGQADISDDQPQQREHGIRLLQRKNNFGS